MKARAFGLIFLLLFIGIAILAQTKHLMNEFASTEDAELSDRQIVVVYGRLPLSFEANQGQTDEQVKFLSRGRGYSLFLTSTEAVLSLNSRQNAPRAQRDISTSHSAPLASSAVSSPKQRSTVLRMKLVGANPEAEVVGREELPGKSNYFIGNDPKQWHTNVPHYAKVKYEDVYPGIDLLYYGTNQRQLEYDFVVAPGADPRAIRLGFEGAETVEVDAAGHLVVELPDGEVRFHKPYIYQESGAAREEIAGNFVLRDDEQIGFEVAAYDTSQPLIIDPVLVYSTYLGGSDLDLSSDIAVDSAGNAYLIGFTSSTNFPTTSSPLQASFGGGLRDTFVAKLNATGSALLYSTYLGGSGSDLGRGITVDSAGNAYLTGSTLSTNFPTANPLQAGSGGSADVFVAKLNPTGSALLYSTYLGRSGDESGFGIAVDSDGNAYLTGNTTSTNFPTVSPLQAAFGGGSFDVFVAKLNSTGSALLYSTYLGGSDLDLSSDIAVDSAGNAYLTGVTLSTDFPTANPLQAGSGGSADVFVAKLNPTGSALLYSTYLGGSDSDGGSGIAVDGPYAYLTGHTLSTDFPTANALQPGFGGGTVDAFVARFHSTGSALFYSSYLGGNGNDQGWGIAVDSAGNAYLTGETASTNFPTTANPLQASSGGSADAFVAKLNSTGSALLYSTYLGGSGSDVGRGIAMDSARNAYLTGDTFSTNFPTTIGAFQIVLAGDRDAFAAKIPFAVVSFTPTSLTFTDQEVGTTSAAQTVTVTNALTGTRTISNITTTGDFAETNTCTNPLATGASCTISVTFTPTTTGTRIGELTFTPGGFSTVPLSGTGVNPVPSISSLSPSQATAGGTDFTLTVNGSSFVNNSVVRWNGSDRNTTFVGAGELQAAIVASDIATLGTAQVTVFNPTPGGGLSNTLTFTISGSGNPAPSISSISPGSVTAEGGNFTLNVNGSSFISDSVVRWNGSDRATTFVSSAQLQAAIPASDIASGGTVNVTVFNPAPGGGTSNAISFTITDFTVGSSPSSVTVSRGQSASYTVTVSPQFGAFDASVSLSCSNLPSLSSCSFSPATLTPGGSDATSTLTVSTTAPASVGPGLRLGPPPRTPVGVLWLGVLALALLGLTLTRRAARRQLRFGLALGLLAWLLVVQVACGGGGETIPSAPLPRPGTPTGTFTITITGTAGSLQHSTTATLVVQ